MTQHAYRALIAVKEIPLTKGKVAIVDQDDFDYLNQWKWFCNSKGYAVRTQKTQAGRKAVMMHRVINNTPEDMDTDHINGDPLDNRKANLRTCSARQNTHNKRSWSNSSSKYKGVSWNKNDKKWKARIMVGGKDIYLGYFESEVDAAKAYNQAALLHFGNFARPNIIVSPI